MKEILVIPNPLLRKKSSFLKDIKKEDVDLSNEMIISMNEAPGVGLAAPQLGILKRIITINVGGANKDENENNENVDNSYALFNPEILWFSKNKVLMEEGCLSIPKQFSDIERPEKIHVKYKDVNNNQIEKEVEGFESRVIQHEIDHLDGKLFIDYLSPLKRKMIINKVKKLNKFKK